MLGNPSSNDEAILDLTDIVEEGDSVEIQGKVKEIVLGDDSLEKELDGLFGEMGQVEVSREAPAQIEPTIDLSDIFDDESHAPSPKMAASQSNFSTIPNATEPDSAAELDWSEEKSLDVATAEVLRDQDEDADGDDILDLGMEHSMLPVDDGEEEETVLSSVAGPTASKPSPARGDDLSELDALIANLDEDLSGSKLEQASGAQELFDSEDVSVASINETSLLDETGPASIPGELAGEDMEISLADVLGKENERLEVSSQANDEDQGNGSEEEISENDAEIAAALAQVEESVQIDHLETAVIPDALEVKIMEAFEDRLAKMQAAWDEKLSLLQKQWQERLLEPDAALRQNTELKLETVHVSLAKIEEDHQALKGQVKSLSQQFTLGFSKQEVEGLLAEQSSQMLKALRSEIPAAAANVVRDEIKALVQDLSKG